MAARTKAAKLPSSTSISSKPSTKRVPEPSKPTSSIATFLRSLRLLDLDLLGDWPGLTEQIFSTNVAVQTLQQRVKGIEWSLYRLFEIYDPSETRSKLQPFFPPLTPLQSLNLRAALFRALTQLKKNGLLGREITLRRTMLDECKGDKFEEVINAFGSLVLQISTPRVSLVATSISSRVDLSQEQLSTLVLAYRSSLQKTLNAKNAVRERARRYADALDQAERDLQQRKAAIVPRTRTISTPRGGAVDEEQIRRSWDGDERWADVLLQGPPAQRTSVLKQNLDFDWADNAPIDETTDSSLELALLDDLNARIARHEARLTRWKAYQSSLVDAGSVKEPDDVPTLIQPRTDLATPLFESHKALHLNISSPANPGDAELLPEHQRLLDAMTRELGIKQGSVPIPRRMGKVLTTGDATSENSLSAKRVDESRQPADAEFDLPQSLERSRDPLPTIQCDDGKSCFSRPQSLALAGSSRESPRPCGSRLDSASAGVFCMRQMHPPYNSNHQSPTTQGPPLASDESGEWMTRQKTPMVSSLLERTQETMSASRFRVNTASSPTMPVPQSAQWELSSPLRSRADTANSRPSLSAFDASSEAPSPHPAASQVNQASTLLERTRQSMMPHRLRKASIKPSRNSQVFPVNPFESPTRADMNETELSQDLKSLTPQGEHSNEEAEYASVFRSRPRVALSPALSPERDDQNTDGEVQKPLFWLAE